MELNTRPEAELYLTLLTKCLTASLYEESAWQPAAHIKVEGKVVMPPANTIIVVQTPYRPMIREDGRDWPLFAYTMVGHKRLANVRHCVELALRDDVPGDLVEAGVWRGGSSIFMRALLQIHGVSDRTVWVCDSFEGMPTPGPVDRTIQSQFDLSGEKYLAVPVERVQENFRKFGLLDGQVRFVKGWFDQTLKGAPIERIAVLRLDADLYHSTRDALEALYHKVSPGGLVIIDDYYAWEGCRRAVDEFRAARGISAEIERVDWTGAYWRVSSA